MTIARESDDSNTAAKVLRALPLCPTDSGAGNCKDGAWIGN